MPATATAEDLILGPATPTDGIAAAAGGVPQDSVDESRGPSPKASRIGAQDDRVRLTTPRTPPQQRGVRSAGLTARRPGPASAVRVQPRSIVAAGLALWPSCRPVDTRTAETARICGVSTSTRLR